MAGPEGVMETYSFHISPSEAKLVAEEVTLPTIELILAMRANTTIPSLEAAQCFSARTRGQVLFAKLTHNATRQRSVKITERIEVMTDLS